MDSQKAVVILLLVTIILSIISVVLTFSVSNDGSGSRTIEKNVYTSDKGPASAGISFELRSQPSTTGGNP